MLKTDILVFAWEAGSAGAIAPVVQRLVNEGYKCEVRAFEPALGVFYERCGDFATVRTWQKKEIENWEWKVTLAGLGHPFQRSECTDAWKQIRKVAPSVVLLDNWKGLERFLLEDNKPYYQLLPDAIAVMDDGTRNSLVRMGLDASMIYVTGHPSLEMISNLTLEKKKELREVSREYLGIGRIERVILFASEKNHNHTFFETCSKECKGIFLQEVNEGQQLWELLLADLEKLNRPYTILMRPHPNETAYYNNRFRTVSWEEADDLSLIAAADEVFGLSSMIVMQSVSWIIPTTNVQQYLHCWHPTNAFFQSKQWTSLYNEGFWGKWGNVAATPMNHNGAVKNVIKLLDMLLSRKPLQS